MEFLFLLFCLCVTLVLAYVILMISDAIATSYNKKHRGLYSRYKEEQLERIHESVR